MNEPRPDDTIEARRWFAQALEDLTAARQLSVDGPARVACFLAHLAVEKAVKATLLAQGAAFRKVHDLFQLRSLLDEQAAVLLSDEALAALNPWVVAGRYPADLDEATAGLATRLVTIADETIAALGELLYRPGG